MSAQDYEQLTLFQEDSPASHSPLPGSEQARMMTVTSGRKCFASYGKSAHCGSLAKMCLESSIWHSTKRFLTWKTQATKGRRLLFRLAASMPRTFDTAWLLWPTPSTGAALCGGTGNFKTLMALRDAGIITEEERRQLSQGNGGKTHPGLLEWLMGYEQAFTDLIPTPTAADYKGGCIKRHWGGELRHASAELPGGDAVWKNWPDEPGIPRVLDGVPNRVDRIKCLGNTASPQQFYPFFMWIAQIESENRNE